MDYDTLRKACVSIRKEPIPHEIEKYLVGIAYHTITNISQIKSETDVVWLKAASKTNIKKVRPVYRKQILPGGEEMPSFIYLTMRGKRLTEDLTLKDLNIFGDKLIILHASDTQPSVLFHREVTSASPIPTSLSAKTSKAGHPPGKSSSASPKTKYTSPSFTKCGTLAGVSRKPKSKGKAYNSLDSGSPSSGASPPDHPDFIENSNENDSDEGSHSEADEEVGDEGEYEAEDYFTAADRAMEQSDEDVDLQFDSTYMKHIDGITDVDRMERIMRQGLREVKAIETVISSEAGKEKTDVWLKQIAEIKKQATYKRTVIGIVGNTGAGKSSIINAILGHKQLLPTSCMRACTAAATEIAWNDSDDPSKKYRAEIEFISKSEWSAELEMFFKEIHDESSAFIGDPDSEAGMTYAKVKAVYPNITKDQLRKTSVDALLRRNYVHLHLGSIKRIVSSSALTFRDSLQRYVDTMDDQKKSKGRKQPEWWPLIKCVKIYTRAHILSAGAVLVDLPGVQDSNPARAAVANAYMKQCSGLWILAPMNRAVNDKAAQTLLGDHFKRQIKMDGMLSNVTFICSKTDDITVDEAVKELVLESEVDALSREADDAKAQQEQYERDLEAIKPGVEEARRITRDAGADHKVWMKIKRDHKKGKNVTAPPPSQLKLTKKRKSPSSNSCPDAHKRLRVDEVEDYETSFDIDLSMDVDDEDTDEEVQVIRYLSTEEIDKKLEDLSVTMEANSITGNELVTQHKELQATIQSLKNAPDLLKSKKAAICIAARNKWSRSKIQEHYALGIQDLDQECAEEDDDENFNPDAAPTRDYAEVARSLPVFCVSSKAYNSLYNGYVDEQTPGFHSLDDTEIPQLITHCMEMTIKNRLAAGRLFLENFTKLLVSLNLWSANGGCGVKLSDAQREAEKSILNRTLKVLDNGLQKACTAAVDNLKKAQAEHIDKLYARATRAAIKLAGPTIRAYGAATPDGGLHWATYRAIVKRNGGPFRSKGTGNHDWNLDLCALFEMKLATGWEKFFMTSVPRIVKEFGKSMTKTFNRFHQSVADRATDTGIGASGVLLMGQKLDLWDKTFMGLADDLTQMMSDFQKDANREVVPVVASLLERGYEDSATETGTGSTRRMRALMEAHIDNNAGKMFRKCASLVKTQLGAMRNKIKQKIDDSQTDYCHEIRRDYMNAVVGVEIGGDKLTRQEKLMRVQLNRKVHEVNMMFTALSITVTIDLTTKDDLAELEISATTRGNVMDEQDAEDVVKEVWLAEEDAVQVDEVGLKADASTLDATTPATADEIQDEKTTEVLEGSEGHIVLKQETLQVDGDAAAKVDGSRSTIDDMVEEVEMDATPTA